MSAVLVAAFLVRALTVLATATLIGGCGLLVLVLPRGDAPEIVGARVRLRRIVGLSLQLLVVATLGELVIRARTMAGGDLAAALAAIPLVLGRTHFGGLWIVRGVALAVALGASRAGGRLGARISLAAALTIALTSSLTGHAADWGDLSASVLVDWLHIVGSALWTGGLLGLVFVLTRARSAWSPIAVATVAHRFSALARACLALVVASGAYGVWVEVPAPAALATTAYGRWLVVKVALVLVVAGLGAVNRYRVLPRLDGGTGATTLFRLIRAEAVFAMLVFACTAGLTESTPARHSYHWHTDREGGEAMHDHVMSPATPGVSR